MIIIKVEIFFENTLDCVAQFVNIMLWKTTQAQMSVSVKTKIYFLDSVSNEFNFLSLKMIVILQYNIQN